MILQLIMGLPHGNPDAPFHPTQRHHLEFTKPAKPSFINKFFSLRQAPTGLLAYKTFFDDQNKNSHVQIQGHSLSRLIQTILSYPTTR